MLVFAVTALAWSWGRPAAAAPPAAATLAVRQVEGPVSWGQHLGDAGHASTAASPIEPPLAVAWRFDDPLSKGGLSSPLAVGDVVIGVGQTRVYLLDAATGEVRHTLIRQSGPLSEPAVTEVDGRPILLFVQGEGAQTALVAIDLGTAEPTQLWTVPLGADSVSGVTVAGDLALVGDAQGDVHAVALGDVAEGAAREAWVERLGGSVDASIAASGDLAFASVNDVQTFEVKVVALRLSDGRRQWVYEPVQQRYVTSVAADGERVVVGFEDRTVRSLDPASGDPLWQTMVRGLLVTLSTSLRSSPVLSDGDVFVEDGVFAVSDVLPGALYRIDGDTGERLWDFQFDASATRSTPLVSGDVVYIGLDDGRLAAVDGASGDLVWIADTGDAGLQGLAPAGDLLVAATGGAKGGFVALRPSTEGELIRVPSPTRLDRGGMLADLGIGLGATFAGLFLVFGVALRRFRPVPGGAPGPAGEDLEPASDPEDLGDDEWVGEPAEPGRDADGDTDGWTEPDTVDGEQVGDEAAPGDDHVDDDGDTDGGPGTTGGRP